MKAVVLGGGVVGVTTAYYLAQEGHEVELVERRTALAQDASSGNACLIAPGHSFSWASPAAPRMMVRSLLGDQTAIRVRARLDPDLIRWGVRFLRECTSARAEHNTKIKLRLAQYSQRALDAVVREEAIDYGHTSQGILYLYRDEQELQAGFAKAELLRRHGQEQEILDVAEIVRREPALAAARDRLAGAVFDRGDSSGDSERFTNELAERCRRLGVRFRLGAAAHRLEHAGDRITGVVVDGTTLRADLYVLALGVDSPRLARTAGLRLPMYPAKGYTATFPIRDGGVAPSHGGVDEATLVAWSNLGDRLRMSSTAEFAGFGRGWAETDFTNIRRMAQELFPDAADYDDGHYRACLRPMTPGGQPIVGFGRHRNLLFNTGHGHMGWTMACGSALIARDLAAGRRPEMTFDGPGARG
jgi:D-amino-acid dehydrogenase